MHKEEVVAILKQHKKIEELDSEIKLVQKETDSQIDFLKKKAEQVIEKNRTKIDNLRSEIVAYLNQNNILPDWYNKEYHDIEIMKGAVWLIDNRNNEDYKHMELGFLSNLVNNIPIHYIGSDDDDD